MSRPSLTIRLLGPPVVAVDGRPIEVDTRKAIALLSCLVLEVGPHSREQLAALLWPESDRDRSRAALRRTLSTLNRALGRAWLTVRREQVSLDTSPHCNVDVGDFRSSIAAGRAGDVSGFERAIEVYQGDLLSGFVLRDSPDFELWVEQRAEELRSDFVDALESVVDDRMRTARYPDAARLAGRWLAADPLNEAAYRALMLAAAARGERSAALSHYRECVRVLDAELGVPPLDETTDLYLAIRSGNQPIPTKTVDPVKVEVLAGSTRGTQHQDRSIFVGRAEELETLAVVVSARTEHGQAVIIEGEAGVGKTRLVDECLEGAGPVLRARCYPGETALAYGPVRELLEAVQSAILDGASDTARREGARLLPELADGEGPVPVSAESPGDEVRFFAGVAELLAAGAGELRQIVVIDDLQWVDRASARLLAYVLRRLEQHPLVVVLIHRSEEDNPALAELLAAAGRGAKRLSILRLDPSEVDEWVGQALGASVDASLTGSIRDESEGLPLLVAEYLSVIQAGDHLAPSWGLPSGAREVFELRLAGLSELERQVLSTASAVGRPFTFETVRAASGRTEDEALGAFDQLFSRRLLQERNVVGEAPQWDFTHDKLRELAYESMTATRRRVVHGRLAEALSRDGAAAQVAAHLALAGREAEAAEQYFRAGTRARELYANGEALSHFTAALALGYHDPSCVHFAIGDVSLLSGDFETGLRSYETAAALSSGEELRHAEHTLGRTYLRLGEFEQARDRFAAALASDDESLRAEFRAEVLADWSLLAYREDDRDRARDLARDALLSAESAASDVSRARARIALGIIARRDGDAMSAVSELEQALDLARITDSAELRASALNALALANGDLGEIDQAISLAEEALDVCDTLGDRQRAAAIHSNLADLNHTRGDTASSEAHLEASVAVLADIGVVGGEHRPEVWRLMEW